MNKKTDASDRPLTSDEISRLEEFLLSDQVSDEAFDYTGAHGFLTAANIGPDAIDISEALPEICAGDPGFASDIEAREVTALFEQLSNSISRELYSGESIQLPCDLKIDDRIEFSELRGWCIGFMDGIHLREDLWFQLDEELVGGLVFPMAVISGLFDEEEIQAVGENPERVSQLAEKIPEALTALYLYFQDPQGFSDGIKPPRLH